MSNNSFESRKDQIYTEKKQQIERFSFNSQVVDVFPDMINRSVPGYSNIVDGIGRLSAKFLKDGARVYDLGCSLGAVSLSIAKHSNSDNVTIEAIDNSAAMINRCERYVDSYKHDATVNILEADVLTLDLQPCSVVVMNFTLQFIEQSKRDELMARIYNALLPGGIFIISEKIKLADSHMDDAIIELHHDFKRDNGYSDLEIAQKRSALEEVMILDTFDTHKNRLIAAGFDAVSPWFQQFNFTSFFAIKKSE
jgi:tRNA (cmo5U34)-methyltransferase